MSKIKTCLAITLASVTMLSAASLPVTPASNLVLTTAAASSTRSIVSNSIYFEYEIGSDNNITITKMYPKNPNATTLIIPRYLDGRFVKRIGKNAAKSTNAQNIKTIEVIAATEFDEAAFQAIPNVTTLKMPSLVGRVAGTTFGPNTKIKNVYIAGKAVNADYITNSIASKVRLKDIGGDQFKITNDVRGLVELIDSLAYSPFADTVCKQKAAAILSANVDMTAGEVIRMQQIYDYIITHNRYSKINMNTDNPLNNLHQQAIGSLFFNSGVCAGRSEAVQYLAQAAKLNVKCVGNDAHEWNLFKPSWSKKYYKIDTVNNDFCIGDTVTTQTAMDGTVCSVYGSGVCIDSTIGVQIINHADTPIGIKLGDINNAKETYANYDASKHTGSLSVNQILNNHQANLYMDANTYYNLTLTDKNGKTVLTWDYALNYLGTKTFKDASGKTHTCKISINKENDGYNEKCVYKSRFVIEIN